MTTAQVVKTSVTFSTTTVLPIQDYVHPDDHTQPTYEQNFISLKLPSYYTLAIGPIGLCFIAYFYY